LIPQIPVRKIPCSLRPTVREPTYAQTRFVPIDPPLPLTRVFSRLHGQAPTRMNLLETTQLVKTYNNRRVVDDVSFVIQQEVSVLPAPLRPQAGRRLLLDDELTSSTTRRLL